MRAEIVLAGMLVSFAVMLTAHVAIVVGLLGRPPRARALVALLVPPLGAWWCMRERLHVRAVVWLAAVVAYLVARALG